MKKNVLTLLGIAAINLVSFSQLKDNGQQIVDQQVKPITGEKDLSTSIGLLCDGKLSTPVIGGNGNQGVMFDVQATNTIVISGFDINLDPGFSDQMTIYSRVGTHVGFESSIVGWTNLGTITVTESGSGVTRINLPLSLEVNPGVVSFYIHGVNLSGIKYSNGTAVGNVLASDANISIKEGTGIGGVFGATYSPRNFEGIIHYCLPQTLSCDSTTTEYNAVNGNNGIFFDISAATNPVQIQQIFADFPTGSNEFNVKLYSRSGTHVGFENSMVGWTLHQDINLLTTQVTDASYSIGNSLGIDIPAGGTRGFYIFSETFAVDYTDDPDPVGTPCNADPNLIIRSGGGSGTLFGGLEFFSRNFNGTIDYCINNLGISEQANSQLILSPNPTSNELTINVEEGNIADIQIVDLLGKICLSKSVTNGISETILDVSSLKNGTYIVKVRTNNNSSVTTKLIKE